MIDCLIDFRPFENLSVTIANEGLHEICIALMAISSDGSFKGA
jgi:hypothetical protein